ncbi:hypothetical protein [Sphingomonas sp. ERG5]|uniref:hypothetical protein n=1 Tax=Sphingomonas sp. ERG5 TaxID=1381597 RepID=UPI0012698D0C|nr:hypothetical protein [Sphingomonas sp. ERG5]
MLKIFPFLMVFLACGCANFGKNGQKINFICNISYNNTISFSELNVQIYPDTHGDYARIDACPDHTLAVDFSSSGLYGGHHETLLRQMRFNANQGGLPIKMSVAGTYLGSDGESRPATLVIKKITGYNLPKETP